METAFESRTVLVTGAAGAIGGACCAVFAAAGAQVVCADIDGQAAAMAALMLGGHPTAGDVSIPDDADRIVAEALNLTGSLDVVVTAHDAFHSSPFSEIDGGEWEPLARIGTPEEVASVAAWLASDEASFVNGARLAVDGGLRIS